VRAKECADRNTEYFGDLRQASGTDPVQPLLIVPNLLVRAIAKETGVTKSTVHRLFQLFGLQPHRSRSFKLSTDAFFVEKLRDVVGLYLNPPDKAVVLCVDEKSQIQALERTQPMLPWGSAISKASSTTTSAMAQPQTGARKSHITNNAPSGTKWSTIEATNREALVIAKPIGR
jgi:hypothetical protein